MPSQHPPEVKFEIGHVLFIDIVGYSRLLINQQSEQIQKLREIVRGTEQVRLVEAEGKLLRLPTGDGGALVFRTTPETPVLCALEISRELKKHPEIRVRMGIHSGPVNVVTDLNEQTNIAGAGINIAQRVMDCGDAGHILVSRHVAEDLEHYPRWRAYLHPLGEVEIKHGDKISVVNFYQDELGNPAVPQKFTSATIEKMPAAVIKPSGLCLRRWILGVLIGTAVVFGVLALLKHQRQSPNAVNESQRGRPSGPSLPIPEKSIAVLPFDNLSRDPDNAYFCEGVQDEILTRLAKVADLKVISRTSTQHFKSAPDNLPEIAKKLGVMHILEGSVQKANNQVRVNVQLINALTDAHLWAETYDRKLTDIFAVESEISKTIAESLQAKLSGAEESSMAKAPTANAEAYELYLKGRFFWNKRSGVDLRKAIDYFQQAIAKDPNYALAYAGLADSYMLLPNYDFGGTPVRESLAPAREAITKALELDDSLAEAHASLGLLDTVEIRLERAVKDFQRAIELNPNYATAHHWLMLGQLSLGRFNEAIFEAKRALELDPLSIIINADVSWLYSCAHQFDEAEKRVRKTLEIDPRFFLAHYYLGGILQLRGHLKEAIPEFQKAVELNNDAYSIAMLGQAYARNGQKDEAQKILARLTEESKSRYISPYAWALLYTGFGDKKRAIDELERAYQTGDTNYLFVIKVDPLLDELRSDPRFNALVQKVTGGK
jgi:TolB-like protein/Tfp pilus assembly protein PilF